MFDQPAVSTLGERRQARPPPLRLPSGPGGLSVKNDNSLKTPMRTPISSTGTPMMFKVDPRVMTPDTAEFPRDGQWRPSAPWTDDENGIIEAYLAKPPRSSEQSYAPGELPPANIIGEIALQIVKVEGCKSPGWSRSFEETRRQVFDVARRESMAKVGGHHRRTPSDISDPADRPEMADVVLEDMIDEVEQDMLIPSFSLALDLSGKDDQKRSTAIPLSSPLDMSFGSAIKGPKRVPINNGAHGSGPRQSSLLQRGQSFTSDDLLDNKKFHVKPNAEMDTDDEASVTVSAEGQNSASPVSIITNSPPSSANSSHSLHEAGMEVEVEPYTPIHQTFPSNIHSSGVTPTNRKISGNAETANSTPKVTVSSEAPWTGKSDSGRRSDEDDSEVPLSDRFTKRQKTRTGSNGSSD